MRALLALCVVALLPSLALTAPDADYHHDIKPILARHCVGCHGPDKQRASLRLDTAKAIHVGGSSGPAVVAGKSADSLLVKAVLGLGDTKVMPPKGDRLSERGGRAAAQTGSIRGRRLPQRKSWSSARRANTGRSSRSFAMPSRRSRDTLWPRNAIDRFILARLEKEGIAPSPEADRGHADSPAASRPDRPAADAREVERSSPTADPMPTSGWSIGCWPRRTTASAGAGTGSTWPAMPTPTATASTRRGTIWQYRDWVIDALNRDMPFDQFTIEQLAGDLLPDATAEQKIATGFHRNTQINEEGGIDLEQFRVEAVVDRVNTTGSVFLGLTVGCCQCHDHKFDPISQKEYYQLFAFFNNVDEPNVWTCMSEDDQRRRHEVPSAPQGSGEGA